MKKLLILIFVVPSLLMAQTNGLTLAETRAAVLSANPSVRESLQRIEAATAVLKQAHSAYLPTVSFVGSVGYLDASVHSDSDLPNRSADGMKQASGGLQASWLLFNGFAREARSLAAKYNVQQSRELADNTQRLLILSATVSFRQAQLAMQSIEIAEQDYAFNTNLEEDAQKRFAAGTIPEAEVHNFSIRALQAESSTLQARFDYKAACAVLAELMALPEAQLPENMRPVAVVFDFPGEVPSLDGELQYALVNRPDYRALQSGLMALAQQVRAAKGDRLPQVDLNGSVNYTETEDRIPENYGNYDSFAGITIKWDLFDGRRKINTVREAQAELRALEQRQQALLLSIRSVMRQRIDEAEMANAVFGRQKKIYDLSARVRDSIEKVYRAGAVSITRLNEAQTDLVRARTGYASSYIACLLVLNRLDVDTGRVMEDIR